MAVKAALPWITDRLVPAQGRVVPVLVVQYLTVKPGRLFDPLIIEHHLAAKQLSPALRPRQGSSLPPCGLFRTSVLLVQEVSFGGIRLYLSDRGQIMLQPRLPLSLD